MQDERLAMLNHWLQQIFPTQDWKLQPLAGDASFRRYFRVRTPTQSWIAMDAPPPKEDIGPFVAVARAFQQHGVQVPVIIAEQRDHGFLLLSDFGDNLFLNILNTDNVDQLYQQAFVALARIQTCRDMPSWSLPEFDRSFILREWQLFYQWVLEKHWALALSVREQYLLAAVFEFLCEEVLAQTRICVHRDYHSRNLLWCSDGTVGVLDFQDAVWGPITYDAVSLLRDCYVAWPRADVERWMCLHYEQLQMQGQLKNISLVQFTRWFDLMGVQRHLKALGIFARLKHLYGKPNYIQDMPRTLHYVLEVSEGYSELQGFREFLQEKGI